jgi:hypothetical protein
MESIIHNLLYSVYKWLNCSFNTVPFLQLFWASVTILLFDKNCFNLLNINLSKNFEKNR